ELLARIRVAVRKLEKNPGVEMMESFEKDYLRIDFSKRSVYIDDREIHMTPIEYKLLALLVMNRGKVLTHNQILKKIWGYEEGADANNLRVFMATLRRKIEKDTTNPRFIITEVGVGYRFSEE
ncbi:MAG: winged helix-turn-helix domain-containing protein, partial [Hominisplanchenecus sp.]